jgi:hypothetical protein
MKDFVTGTRARWIVGTLIGVAIFLLAFGLGVSVGYEKALFSSEGGINYERNFLGPRPGMIPGTESEDLHGVAGTVINVSGTAISVKDDDNNERSIMVASDTVIREMDETISLSGLKAGDHVVAIGAPNAAGQVEAHFIRVFPAGTAPPFPPQP